MPGRHRACQRDGFAGQQLGAAAGHEHLGLDQHPQTAELRPAEHVLQWQTGDPAVHQGGQLERGGGLGHQQVGLLFGEHAAGRPEPGHQLSGRAPRLRSQPPASAVSFSRARVVSIIDWVCAIRSSTPVSILPSTAVTGPRPSTHVSVTSQAPPPSTGVIS